MGELPAYVTPYATLAVGHDDNLFQSNTFVKSSPLYIVTPGFKLDARGSNAVFQGNYSGAIGRYTDSSDDDYIDYTVRNQLDYAFDSRTFLRLGYDYFRSHDPRGSTDRPVSSSPDRYHLNVPSATFAYGVPGAPGRIELYLSENDKRYINNRDTTANGDYSRFEYGGAFYWRVMPKTYLLAEARQADVSYKLPNVASGRETKYFGGVSWEATALTTGTLKFGRMERTSDLDAPKFTGTTWEALINWAPRTYSTFDFYSSRNINEASGVGRYIVSDSSGVTWNHNWSSYLFSTVLLRYTRDDFQGSDRRDETKSVGLKVGYRMRRWLTFGAEYTYTQRDSNQQVYEYDRNLYLLTATASM